LHFGVAPHPGWEAFEGFEYFVLGTGASALFSFGATSTTYFRLPSRS
jgi:hypothetical protein